MELEGDDRLGVGQRTSDFVGGVNNGQGVSNGSIVGEHPYGELPSRTLFVRNINSNVEDTEIKALFEQYGDIRTLYTACKHRGFVMISYYDIRAARNAMRSLQNKPLRRRKLDIHYSIPKDNPSEKDINQGTLVIFNLDSSVSTEKLHKIFGVYGEIKELLFVVCRSVKPLTSHHKFIEYYDIRAAEAALSALNRSDIAGKQIKLEQAVLGVQDEYHDSLANSIPYNSTSTIGGVVRSLGSKVIEGINSRHIQGVGSNGHLMELNEGNKCNVGYAFINMTDPQQIIPFHKAFNGKKWEKFNSEKVASLAYARIQGKAALIAHFQNSSLMNEDKRCRPILFHTDGPNAGDPEPFPMGTNIRSRLGKPRTNSSEENHHRGTLLFQQMERILPMEQTLIRTVTLGPHTLLDPLYSDIPKPRRDKSQRKPLPTPMKLLIQRAKQEKEARRAQPCRMLEHPPDNGLLVPELVEVAHQVYRARQSLLSGLAKLVKVIPVQRCRFCNEVHIGHVGHEIRTCVGPGSGSRSATHVWRRGGVQDVVFFPKCFHLYDRVGKPRVGHSERHSVPRIPAIVELCIQAGVNLEKLPTRRRTKPVYSMEGRIVDFELVAETNEIKNSHFENIDPLVSSNFGTEFDGVTTNFELEKNTDNSDESNDRPAERDLSPKGHKVRMCKATKHQSRDGQHAWQEATIEDLVGPNYVWHVRDLNGPSLDNKLKRYYGKAPAVVELCVQTGTPVPDQYRSMMRLDVIPPNRDEVDLVA
ncbi:hypothetical protein GH714_025431 [Hevea brasiliensis]|uniref:RRM domain-containing protein n=1 Tax=Hevea brasiliensis TaxID=3981 RepID=A0A6A6MFF6_HEVBR|nr:hypothetical protein GH714_025431 [Hevea brasiliensis]